MTELAERSANRGAQSQAAGVQDSSQAVRLACRADARPDGVMPTAVHVSNPGVADTREPSPMPWQWWRNGRRGGRGVATWPLILLAAPATVAVWSGWVRLGQMTGFGIVRPFPGLWDSFQVNTAITLPIGVEAYGAYALRAWLAAGARTTGQTRRFAKWSAIGSLLLGMSGQVAYHLLSEARVVRAPWEITMAVACLPVLVLGMGAALSHLLHADADREHTEDGPSPSGTASAGPGHGGDPGSRQPRVTQPDGYVPPDDSVGLDGATSERLEIARVTALRLTSTGVRVSRRTLRDAGLRGSNAELSALVKAITADLTTTDVTGSSYRVG